jgi:hypothetical protein
MSALKKVKLEKGDEKSQTFTSTGLRAVKSEFSSSSSSSFSSSSSAHALLNEADAESMFIALLKEGGKDVRLAASFSLHSI